MGRLLLLSGPFGSLVTNMDGTEFLKLGFKHRDSVYVTLGTEPLTIHLSALSATWLSISRCIDFPGRLGLAVNQGNFAAAYKIKPPASLEIARAK